MSLVLHQFRYDQKAFWRNPASVFFTVMFPVIVFIMAMMMCTAMLLFIVPVFAKMFSSLGGKLPAPTRLLMDASNILKSYFPIFLLMLIVMIVV